jgi:hypothetical protein
MTRSSDDVAAMARRACDELAIMKLLGKLARAQDDLDVAAYKSCFAERVMLTAAAASPDWSPREIPIDELAKMVFANISRLDAGHHMICNHIIDVDGDEATCLADFYAVGILIEDGRTSSAFAGGRNFVRLRRQGAGWVIFERSASVRYRGGDPTLHARAAARTEARKSEAAVTSA